jgi:hypothetical protein
MDKEWTYLGGGLSVRRVLGGDIYKYEVSGCPEATCLVFAPFAPTANVPERQKP